MIPILSKVKRGLPCRPDWRALLFCTALMGGFLSQDLAAQEAEEEKKGIVDKNPTKEFSIFFWLDDDEEEADDQGEGAEEQEDDGDAEEDATPEVSPVEEPEIEIVPLPAPGANEEPDTADEPETSKESDSGEEPDVNEEETPTEEGQADIEPEEALEAPEPEATEPEPSPEADTEQSDEEVPETAEPSEAEEESNEDQIEEDSGATQAPQPLVPAEPSSTDASDDAPSSEEGEVQTLGSALRDLMIQNPVVARVDGREIRWVDVIRSAEDLPLEQEAQVEALFPALLDRMIDLTLIGEAGRQQGYAGDPEIQVRVQAFEEQLIRERFIQRELSKEVTEDAVQARYDRLVASVGRKPQLRARHILVESPEEAASLISQLQEGGDFALLAQAHSNGPSAARGGDLGYFDPDRMVPEFSEAAMALNPGEVTTSPVKSPFGWHVIELLDKRFSGVPPFEEMREALREQVTEEAMDKLLSRLRDKAEIEVFPDGSIGAIGE